MILAFGFGDEAVEPGARIGPLAGIAAAGKLPAEVALHRPGRRLRVALGRRRPRLAMPRRAAPGAPSRRPWKAEYEPDVRQRIPEDITRTLDEIRRSPPELAPGQAWQSDQALHELDEFRERATCIEGTAADGDYRASGSWPHRREHGSGRREGRERHPSSVSGLLFPAWRPHSVDPNRSDRTRISISFNVMFSSYAEELSKPLW